MILHQFSNADDHSLLIGEASAWVIQGKILIDPNPAEPFLINGNHIFLNLKWPKSRKQSLKPNDTLLQHVQSLNKTHLINSVKFQWAVFIVDHHIDSLN